VDHILSVHKREYLLIPVCLPAGWQMLAAYACPSRDQTRYTTFTSSFFLSTKRRQNSAQNGGSYERLSTIQALTELQQLTSPHLFSCQRWDSSISANVRLDKQARLMVGTQHRVSDSLEPEKRLCVARKRAVDVLTLWLRLTAGRRRG
jgi:hypothetical protein